MAQQYNSVFESSDIETTPCPVCGSSEFREEIAFSPFSVLACKACQFFYLSPRLKEETVTKIYQDDNYYNDSSNAGYSDYLEQELALRATYRRFLNYLRRNNLSDGDLLEIGCGFGYLLDEAGPYFDKKMGTDFSPGACDAASRVADRVFLGGLDQVSSDVSVDVVVALNVLEHTYQPVKFLEEAKSLLKPKGKIIIAVPNMDSFIRKLMGRNWPSYKIPEHTLYFNQSSLDKIMRIAGFSNVKKIPFLHAFPLTLIAGKFKIDLPESLRRILVWVPSTMVASIGEKGG
jgi:SAM-dependent methyltransferase